MSSTSARVLSFALYPLGLGGFLLGVADVVQGYRSLQWTPVPAVVLSSTVEPRFFAPNQPEIRYRYNVGGKSYVSAHIWPGNLSAYMPVRGATARRIVDQYTSGRTVAAYVNPIQPTVVALVPGPAKANLTLGIFTFFLLSGCFALLTLTRWRK